MTYRCPSCSAKLRPEAGTSRLQCPGCQDFWRADGRGRLRRAQRYATVKELVREREASELGSP